MSKATNLDRRIGERLRKIRHEERMTMEEMGELLGISGTQVHKTEIGIDRLPASRAVLLCAALDRPITDLLGGLEMPRKRRARNREEIL